MEILGVLFVSEGTFPLTWDFAVTLVPCRMLQEENFLKLALRKKHRLYRLKVTSEGSVLEFSSL